MAVLNSLGVSGRTAGPSTAGRSGAAVRVAGCSVEIVMCQVAAFRSQIADRSSCHTLQASDRTAMRRVTCDLRYTPCVLPGMPISFIIQRRRLLVHSCCMFVHPVL